MLSLKKLCLLKVSSLQLPFDELPMELSSEIRKMQIFNGNFYGPDEYSVITIQYQGDETWQFWIKYWRNRHLLSIVIKEDQSCMIPSATICGLSNFGLFGIVDRNKKPIPTVLRVERGPDSDTLIIRTTLSPVEPNFMEVTNKFIMNNTENPRTVSHVMTLGSPGWTSPEMPLVLHEGQVSAKDAYPQPFVDSAYSGDSESEDDD